MESRLQRHGGFTLPSLVNSCFTSRYSTTSTEAFGKFLNLYKVEITVDETLRNACAESPSLLRQAPELKACKLTIQNLTFPHPRGRRQFEVMARALAQAGRTIHEFSFELHSCDIVEDALTSSLEAGAERFALEAFGGLKTLNITTPALLKSETKTLNTEKSTLSIILQAATNLKSLSVHLPSFLRFSCVSWDDVICPQHAPNLENLIIKGAEMSEASFLAFLQHSSQKLRKFTLHNARIRNGAWTTIFRSLHEFQDLDDVTLSNLIYTYQGSRYYAMNGEKIASGELCIDPQPLYDYKLINNVSTRRKASVYALWCYAEAAITGLVLQSTPAT